MSKKTQMTLLELKKEWAAGNLSAMKLAYRIKHHSTELDTLYPISASPHVKMYLYLNDMSASEVSCAISGKVRSFIGIDKGFRQFCGAPQNCACNLSAIKEGWKAKQGTEMDKINAKRRSTVQIKYGVDSVSQLEESKQKAEETCLERYGTKSPTQNPEVLKKSIVTCFKNNGVEYPQQNSNIFQKTTNTFQEKYGVDRPAQHDKFKEQAKTTMVDRYGQHNPMLVPEIANKVTVKSKTTIFNNLITTKDNVSPKFSVGDYVHGNSETSFLWECTECSTEFHSTIRDVSRGCPTCYPSNSTWGERLIEQWLNDAGITYEAGSFSVISPQQLDFYIPSKNLAIEFNGLYWHSELAGRGRTYHINKTKKCDQLGIKLIHVFEHELINKESIVKSRIMNALGSTPRKIYARKCKILEISWRDAKKFYEENHIQGSLTSKINLALIHQEEIVSVMSFTKTRFSKKLADWELTRFASISNTNVVGAASKLFKHFTKRENAQSIVSYADLRWGNGNTYNNMGFVHSHISQPNYWYFKSINDVSSRVKYQKHKLSKDLHHIGSEWDIMQYLGWNRFWDCGNAVWVWRK